MSLQELVLLTPKSGEEKLGERESGMLIYPTEEGECAEGRRFRETLEMGQGCRSDLHGPVMESMRQ